MGRVRGFLLKHRIRTFFRPPERKRVEPFSLIVRWTRGFRAKAKAILTKKFEQRRGYRRVGIHPGLGKDEGVPKGYLAVYVGQKEEDFERVLVPVANFNHPLFGDLLKESEKEYGFDHPGGITIPCQISEFERVQTRIRDVQWPRKFLSWKRSHGSLMMPF